MSNGIKCEHCHIGTLHRRRRTHTRWLAGHLILVPNIEILLCDVCGEFSEANGAGDAAAMLENLLGVAPIASVTPKPVERQEGEVVVVTTSQRRST